jgi:hypothetical protein
MDSTGLLALAALDSREAAGYAELPYKGVLHVS